MTLVPNSESLREANSCHTPAGSPKGGQFCSKDAFAPVPKGGAIPRTGEMAAGQVGVAFRNHRIRQSVARGENQHNSGIRRDLDNTFDDAAKSWYDKVFKTGARPEDARAEVYAAAAAGMAANAANARYQRVVNRFSDGQDHVVVVRAPEDDSDTVLSSGAAGQRIAATSILFDHPFWTEPAQLLVSKEPAPGDMTAESSGGVAAILRHEYGHHIYGNFNQKDTDAWRATLRPLLPEGSGWYRAEYPALKDTLTYYAVTNEAEAFCETFAIWTHPKYRKAAFPASVHPLFEWMDRRFGGRLIEGAAARRL